MKEKNSKNLNLQNSMTTAHESLKYVIKTMKICHNMIKSAVSLTFKLFNLHLLSSKGVP